jgi:hypothetical protein
MHLELRFSTSFETWRGSNSCGPDRNISLRISWKAKILRHWFPNKENFVVHTDVCMFGVQMYFITDVFLLLNYRHTCVQGGKSNSQLHKWTLRDIAALHFFQKTKNFEKYLLTLSTLHIKPRVARWFVFKPKIQIWVNFGGTCNGRCWYILWTLGLFYSLLLYFMDIGYSSW